MYEYLKSIMPVAELIGTPEKVTCCTGDNIFGDVVSIRGTTSDGYKFSLELKVEVGKDA